MRRTKMTLAAGLAAASLALNAQAQLPGAPGTATTQDPDRATRTQQTGQAGDRLQNPGQAAPGQAQGQHADIDRETAIGHALCMAIDGASLWNLAKLEGRTVGGVVANAAEAVAKAAGGERRDAASELERHAREAFQESRRLFEAVREERQAGAAGDPGRSQARERFHRAALEYARTLESLCQGASRAAEADRPAADRPATIAANRENDEPKGLGAALAGGILGQGAREAGATGGSRDEAGVALVNHAVKESVQAVALRGMLMAHDERGETARALRDHAEQMLRSGQQALQFADRPGRDAGATDRDRDRQAAPVAPRTQGAGSTGAGALRDRPDPGQGRRPGGDADLARPRFDVNAQAPGRPAGGAAEPASADSLARLAREVIDAVQQLDPTARGGRDGGRPAQERRPDR